MAFTSTDEHDYPRITPAVQWLIAINVAVFFLQIVLPVGAANAQAWFGFQFGHLTDQPWTFFTYMFVHQGFLHLALNMYSLWLFGPRVEHAWSAHSFTRYYVLCGLAGWLAHIMFVRTGTLIGASAAVYGVMLAYAMRWPDDELYLFGVVPMRVKWLVTLLVGLDIAAALWESATGAASSTAHFAHLGGLAFGFMYLRTSSGSFERLRQRMSQVPDVPDETPRAIPRSHPRPRERERGQEIDEIVARSNAIVAKRPTATPTLPNKASRKKVDELDLVLDKISSSGIESLTRDERRLLEEMSKKLRGRS